MAIKTNYDFNGINIEGATIRVDRLWGSSKEGWNSLVRVYTTVKIDIPTIEEVTEQRLVSEATGESEAVYEEIVITEAKEAYTKEELRQIQEFNHLADYIEDERGYVTIYKSLMKKFGGVEV
jgi:hypothetical protein